MLSYTTEFMYAYYNSDKLFFMSNTITEIILATGEARFAVNLEEWLGNGVFVKSVISPYFLNAHESFALYLCYTLSTRDALAVKISKTLVLQQTTFLFDVTPWCCSLNCCVCSAQYIQVWDAVGSFSVFAFEFFVCKYFILSSRQKKIKIII